MTIWFDRSERSVVAICSTCGRRHAATTQGRADSWAIDHARRCDAGPRALAALHERRRQN